MDKEIVDNILEMAANKDKRNFFYKLIRSNSGVSSKNFFLVVTTVIGTLLLAVIFGGFVVDIIFHHTITIDMSGAAYFIGAVASLFASAGITKAWSDSSTNKYLAQHPESYERSSEDVAEEEEEYENIIPDEE